VSRQAATNGSESSGLPTAFAVIDDKRVPLDYTAQRRLALNAHLLSLGNPKRASEMLAEAELAGNSATAISSAADLPSAI
jgi:hypothetical protein